MNLTRSQKSIVTGAMKKYGVPGVAVSLVRGGEIIAAEGFGYRDLAGKLPATPDTCWPICSLTKSFTAVSVMHLVEAGKVRLDRPVQHYLPDFGLADEAAARAITPRMCLSHSSGIGRTGQQAGFLEERSSQSRTRQDVIDGLHNMTPQTAPMESWSYCNEGFVTMGVLVDRLSGETFEDHLRRTIFKPLDMTHTHIGFAGLRGEADRTLGYVPDAASPGGLRVAKWPDDYAPYHPTGGIGSTAMDMAKYQIATMDHGASPLLSPGSLDLMQTISKPYGDSGWGYGLGWEIRFTGGVKIVAHGGSLPGIATHSLMIPSLGLGVIVLTNLAGGPSQLLAEQLMSDMLGVSLFSGDGGSLPFPASLPFTTNQPDISAAEKTACAGAYQFGKTTITVEPADTGIKVTQPKSEYSTETVSTMCLYLGDNFFMGRQPGGFPMIQFVKDGGKVTHLLSGGNKFKKA